MKNSVYIATSLDGYIADNNSSVDWLCEIPNPDNNDFGFNDFIKSIDAIFMGRNTFQQVLSFYAWPYPKPVYVLSSTINKLPDELSEKVMILNIGPTEVVERLNNEGLKNLYIDGGQVIQNFLSADLIDELIITTIPILLGGGIPLFGS